MKLPLELNIPYKMLNKCFYELDYNGITIETDKILKIVHSLINILNILLNVFLERNYVSQINNCDTPWYAKQH